MSALGPVVLLPVGVDEVALDACLAALEAGTPAGTPVWLADDAQAGPRVRTVIDGWLARTRLQATYSRRERAIGEVPHLDQMLTACGNRDVAVLPPSARPAPGWLDQLVHCLACDPAIATATPWSNAGGTASWPRLGQLNPVLDTLARLAAACAVLPPRYPELPGAVTHAVLLRGRARQRAGGLDVASYRSWYGALTDLSLRLAGLGWRNVLCETAFVARSDEEHAAEGDLPALAARWPAWPPRLAGFLMRDPLQAERARLASALAALPPPDPQGQLFVGARQHDGSCRD